MAARWLHMATDSESHANHMRIDWQIFQHACHHDRNLEKIFQKIFKRKSVRHILADCHNTFELYNAARCCMKIKHLNNFYNGFCKRKSSH
jgi:hypothetical protein